MSTPIVRASIMLQLSAPKSCVESLVLQVVTIHRVKTLKPFLNQNQISNMLNIRKRNIISILIYAVTYLTGLSANHQIKPKLIILARKIIASRWPIG